LRLHDACRVIFTHAISIHSRLNLYFISRCVFSFYSLFNFLNSYAVFFEFRYVRIFIYIFDPVVKHYFQKKTINGKKVITAWNIYSKKAIFICFLFSANIKVYI
jgi:hypothetical protein